MPMPSVTADLRTAARSGLEATMQYRTHDSIVLKKQSTRNTYLVNHEGAERHAKQARSGSHGQVEADETLGGELCGQAE